MTTDEERQYREIHQQVVDGLFASSAKAAGEAVVRGIKYRTACSAIYAAHYQALFGAALKELQQEGKLPTAMTVADAWADRKSHELVAHEIVRKALFYLDRTDDRYVWAVNIMKKKKQS